MRGKGRERWLPIVLSVLFHGSLLAALGWGWWTFRRPVQAMHTLAIEGSVVRASTPKAVTAEPATAPVPAAATQAAPPPPAPDPARVLAEQQAAAKAEQERLAVARRAEEQANAEREARKRAEAEAAAAAKVEADKQAKAEAERQAKAAAERAAAKRAAEEKQAQLNDINSQLAAEQRLNDARASGQQAQYVDMIRNHITRQWLKPPGTPPAMDCVVKVRQVSGGEVTAVNIGACDASAAIKQSIEDAVYRASPLPAPPTPDLFEPVLEIHFHGSDQ